MNVKKYWQKYRSEFLFYFGFLTILGVAFYLQAVYADSLYEKTTKPTTQETINVFVDRIVSAYLWLLFAPFIIGLLKKSPLKISHSLSFFYCISL